MSLRWLWLGMPAKLIGEPSLQYPSTRLPNRRYLLFGTDHPDQFTLAITHFGYDSDDLAASTSLVDALEAYRTGLDIGPF